MSCFYSEKGLDLEVAIKILENFQEYTVINQPPIKPKGGEVYLFLPQTPNEQENYKCDQYRWLNSGPKEIPRKNPLVKKQYFIGKLPQGKTQAFQKHCYVLIGEDRSPYPVLLHYIGDETVMVDFPHGNSKRSTSTYFAIAPSVRKEIANKSKSAMPTAILNSYKSALSFETKDCSENEVNPVLTPRNKSQVRNIRRKQKLSNFKDCVSKEDLSTLHSLAHEPCGFMHYIQTQPGLLCIVGINELSVELQNFAKLNNLIVFSFHDSHKVGKYYITPFSFMHGAFSEMPTIPCYFLITEVCDFVVYKRFLQTLVACIPMLLQLNTVVITNQDLNITSVLSHVLPNLQQMYDWEILFTSARAFLRKLSIDIKDISLRIKQLKALMSAESLEEYRIELERYKHEWPSAFCDYYSDILSEVVETSLGRWLLERYGLYSPHLGVYRGINEDLQLVIKNLQESKEPALDIILPSLYQLQTYLYASIQKGFCNLGRYALSGPFKFLQRDIDELVLPDTIYEPADIVKVFRVRGITLFSDMQDPGSNDDTLALFQAQRIVEMDHVSHCTALNAFLVKSISGALHGVKLFPRESCSCSTNQRCAHILAVMLTLGMPVTYDNKGSLKVLKPQLVYNIPAEEANVLAEIALANLKQRRDVDYVEQNEENALRIDLSQDSTKSERQQDTNDDNKMCVPDTQQPSSDNYTSLTSTNMPQSAVTFTSLPHAIYHHEKSANIVQVSQADLQGVLNGTHGSEVLMVVTDASVGGQTSEEVMLAYTPSAQPTEQQCPATVEGEGLEMCDEKPQDPNMDAMEGRKDMTSSSSIIDETKSDGESLRIGVEIPPAQLILSMSEVMHQSSCEQEPPD